MTSAPVAPPHRLIMTDARWREHFQTLQRNLPTTTLGELRPLGIQTRHAIEELDPVMSRYCAETCPQCVDVCCTALYVVYNPTDMIYLHALGYAVPVGQTREHYGEPCRYLQSTGCALPRILRPYVCTWFLCDAHMGLFSLERPSFQRRIIAVLMNIRNLRTSMLEAARPFLPADWFDA